MSENKTWNIKIQGEVEVTAPADISDLVTYVLLEQEDWCEPEIDFVREFIESGMTTLDLDAGYGVYALAMAQEMEGEGKVIALNTHEYFSQSVQENGLQELITTELDDSPLDFIRLGEAELDENLIQQGDPLIMFPAERLQYLRDQGLDIYRYIPGLKALAPLQDDAPAKGYLFACTRARADKLRKLKLLADSLQEELQPSITWEQYLPQFPYTQSLLQLWETSYIDSGFEQAINLYVSSRDPNLTLDQRYRLLRQSRKALSSLNKAGDTHAATIVSLIRAYVDLGEEQKGTDTFLTFLPPQANLNSSSPTNHPPRRTPCPA